MDEQVLNESDQIAEEKTEQEKFSCEIRDFQFKVCSPERTGVLFLGRQSENIDEVMDALKEAEESLDMNVGVLDLNDNTCEALSEKYSIDRDATQFIVFQDCEKISGCSLEENPKGQLLKLKESLDAREKQPEL